MSNRSSELRSELNKKYYFYIHIKSEIDKEDDLYKKATEIQSRLKENKEKLQRELDDIKKDLKKLTDEIKQADQNIPKLNNFSKYTFLPEKNKSRL